MSNERKLDIIGIMVAVVGFLTLLSLVSPTKSDLIAGWVHSLSVLFGWGVFIFPFALLLIGIWLVLRNVARIPVPAVERMVGLILLFLNILTLTQLLSLWIAPQDNFALAEAGKGGGLVGAGLLHLLRLTVGNGGSAIVLIAWMILALALALDVTILEMVRWIAPRLGQLYHLWLDWWEEARAQRAKKRMTTYPLPQASTSNSMAPSGLLTTSGEELPFAPLPGEEIQKSSQVQSWVLPPVDQILETTVELHYDDTMDSQRARVIEETLASFGAPVRVVEVNRGPTITQYGVEPDYIESRSGRTRVRVSKITSLADDLALALSARAIRIEAPVPGKGFIGIEVPNEETALVTLRHLVESEAFKRLKSPLRFALGLNVSGHAVAADLAAMPHLLIAGATGSGKSVCVNALIACLLLHNTPDDLRMIMVDPKRVELTGYNGIPHLIAPVVVDIERVVTVLQWVSREMDMRYRKLAEAGCRNITEYNAIHLAHGQKKLPLLVVVIDELADLMMIAPDETERTITRLAQLARATGIHLVISTQRPSVDVVTGLIKANFPARIAFAVASGVDSRVILDQPGAERLLGRGDMLFQAPEAPAPVRLQGVFVSDVEIQRLVEYWRSFLGVIQPSPTAIGGIADALPSGVPLKQLPMWEEVGSQESHDPLLEEAIDLARRQGRASISMLQRRLRIGYTRAARLIESMEAQGIVGPPDPGTGTREILDYGPAAPPADEG